MKSATSSASALALLTLPLAAVLMGTAASGGAVATLASGSRAAPSISTSRRLSTRPRSHLESAAPGAYNKPRGAQSRATLRIAGGTAERWLLICTVQYIRDQLKDGLLAVKRPARGK